MSAYHAYHESPYADDCPDCTGFGDDPCDPEQHPHQAAVALLALALAVALLLIVRRAA